MNADANQLAYLKWLAIAHPDIYRKVVARAKAISRNAGLGELGWINFVVQAIATVGSTLLQKKQIDKQVALQKKALALSDAQAAADREQAVKFKLLEVNTTRAQNGLPPVDILGKVIPSGSLPTPSALAPYAKAGSSATLLPGVPNVVTYTGGGLLGLLLLRQLKVL